MMRSVSTVALSVAIGIFTGSGAQANDGGLPGLKIQSVPTKQSDNPGQRFFELAESALQVELSSWKDIPQRSSLSSQATKISTFIPRGLSDLVASYRKDLLRNKLTEEQILNAVLPRLAARGWKHEKLAAASAKKLLQLSMELVMDQLEYFGDTDKVYDWEKNNLFFYFDLGRGDCDKYAGLSSVIYYTLKDQFQNTEHLYLLDENVGSNAVRPMEMYLINPEMGRPRLVTGHAWLAVLSLSEKGVWKLGHLDPTWADHDGNVDALDETHVDHETWRYYFFKALNNPRAVIAEFKADKVSGDHSVILENKLDMLVWALHETRDLNGLASLHRYMIDNPKAPRRAKEAYQVAFQRNEAASAALLLMHPKK
jgi:hypothetical protein